MSSSGPTLRISLTTLSMAASLWLLAFDNSAFWRGAWAALAKDSTRGALALGLLALVLWLLFGLVLRLLCWRWTAKPVLVSTLVLGAAAAYFIEAFGIVIDRGMIRNVLETDWREASDLMSAGQMWDMAWRGLLPASLIVLAPIRPEAWRASLWSVGRQAVAFGLVLAVALGTFFAEYASAARNNRELRHVLTPSNVVNGFAGLWKERNRAPEALTQIAEDAVRPAVPSSNKPLVVVLVVGETARAASFSLGGYQRPTNEALANSGLVYFGNVTACGTDTATSLPCMFSNLGADNFSVAATASRENVLDVLARTGVAVRWLENNSGCKGVCDWIETRFVNPASAQPGECDGAECLDAALVRGLRDALAAAAADSLVVLHMRGSHGPAYFKRYPAAARLFTPTCDTHEIQRCDLQALRNTYDNTIAYTSQVIAQMLGELAARADVMDSVFVYVSDHGESLGESGVYLHGMPKWMAPREQTQVPLMVWLSEGAGTRLGVSQSALRAAAGNPYSHDNLFHTLVGAFGIRTSAYRSDQDLLTGTRPADRGPTGASPRSMQGHRVGAD